MNNFRNFIWWGAILFPALLILTFISFKLTAPRGESVFYLLAASIMVSWVLILVLYYVWAIYFYNINRGWTDKDWTEHETNRGVVPAEDAPVGNPNNEETLGLPAGTVRGTIALSVLVGGLAMMIASLSFPGRLKADEFVIDNFEFMKTAFLMVIAFYFGSKSLEQLNRKTVITAEPLVDNRSQETTKVVSEAPAPVQNEAHTDAKKALKDDKDTQP